MNPKRKVQTAAEASEEVPAEEISEPETAEEAVQEAETAPCEEIVIDEAELEK